MSRRAERLAQTVCLAVLVLAGVRQAAAVPVLPRETAEQFGRLNMSYNDRICPVQTYAIDFTRKLCGKPRYAGFSAEQVLTGFLLWPDEWSREPVIRVKGAALKEALHLPGYCGCPRSSTLTADIFWGPI